MSQQSTNGEITRLLADWVAGRPEPAPVLWHAIYQELRPVARAYVRKQRLDHTLQATALINEAYVRIFQGRPSGWGSRKHFFCAMAQVMRQILVDHARECHAQKRGGGWERIPLDIVNPAVTSGPEDLLALHDALEELAQLNPRQSQVVEMRYFAGLTREQTASMLNISPETVKLDCKFAKAWLRRRLRHAGEGDDEA